MGLLSNPVSALKFSLPGIRFTRKLVIMRVIGLGRIFCGRAFRRFIYPERGGMMPYVTMRSGLHSR